ncbi:hypothetical protein L484_017782 [Morus notabilis]|uniref:Uncharacterized protein n=1 Tax=Morus notabilis TaxID=981085 RepID=W9R3F2_9ROSA|nr:hypothetical protein L484_017782 [Morus notabilis]
MYNMPYFVSTLLPKWIHAQYLTQLIVSWKCGDSWSGLALNANRIQESIARWAGTETREETKEGDHWVKGGQAQDSSPQDETTRGGLRLEEELINKETKVEKIPEGESAPARETRVRRAPKWLNGFELNGGH